MFALHASPCQRPTDLYILIRQRSSGANQIIAISLFSPKTNRKIVASKTIKECEQTLSDHRFFRVHNSHLINLDFVAEYNKVDGGVVKMSDGTLIEVSRRRKDEFLRVLGHH